MKCNNMDDFICNIASSIKEYTSKTVFLFSLMQLLIIGLVFGSFYYFYNDTNKKYEFRIRELKNDVDNLSNKVIKLSQKDKRFNMKNAVRISTRNKIDGTHITYRIIRKDLVQYYTEVFPNYK